MHARRLLLLSLAAFVSTGQAQSVTVEAGDSLWSLAQRFDVTVDALMEANDLTDPSLRPGDTLALPGAAATDVYVVQPGDSLYGIAHDAGVTLEQLMAWNDLASGTINPGAELRLTAPEAAAAEPLVVTVKPGDTLWAIANRFEVDAASLAAANGLDANGTLHPGDALTVPGRSASAQAGGDLGGPAAPTITVDPGDSLWQIARRYNTTVQALMEANELRDGTVMAGQELVVVNAAEAGRATAPAPSDSPAGTADGGPVVRVWPLEGAVTSTFGWRSLRIGGSNMHYGVDIDGHTGQTIRAAAEGTVTHAGWLGGFGKLVIVERGEVEYYYAHASELLVTEGRWVNAGDAIARVGTTGRVTGSHLHFEVRVSGSPMDPMPLLQAQRAAR